MNDDKPLTGVRKRQQIVNANKQMFIWVAVAAVVVAVCAVLVLNFTQRIIYQVKVNGKISETADVMSNNVNAVANLTSEVNKLSVNQNLNLANLKPDDSTAFQVVLDALPTEDNRVSLGASLQKKILVSSGVTIDQISVTDANNTTATTIPTTDTSVVSSVNPTAQPITFSIVLNGNYNAIQRAVADMERSIRPITIDSLTLQGADDSLQATINATTYYAPKVNYQLGKEEVQP